MNLSVLIPVYNSAAFIESSFKILHQYLSKHFDEIHIKMCDDGSCDNSLEILAKLQGQYEKVEVFSNSKNCGKGASIKKMIPSIQTEYVIVMDCDLPLQIDLNILKQLVYTVDSYNADVVVASRYHDKAVIDRKLSRKFVSWFHRKLVKVFFPSLKCSDPDVGLKAYRSSALKKYGLEAKLNRWSWDLQVLVLLSYSEKNIIDIPLDWKEKSTHPSTVRIFKDSLEELGGMIYAKFYLWKRLYW